MIRYHLDQHVSSRIAKALRRRQIDVTTTAEAALQDADDVDHVQFALAESRVIVTNDPDFLALDQAGTRHAGICYWEQQTRTLRHVIEMLVLIHECYDAVDMMNHVEYL